MRRKKKKKTRRKVEKSRATVCRPQARATGTSCNYMAGMEMSCQDGQDGGGRGEIGGGRIYVGAGEWEAGKLGGGMEGSE